MKTFLVIVATAICFSAYAAVDSRSGAWTAELVDGTTLQMSIFEGRSNTRNGYGWGNVTGFNELLSSFSGLSAADATAGAANVRFELRRAAGTVTFDGRFSEGTGAGHFKFMPSESFVREMAALGYSDFSDRQLLMFAVHDFSPQIVRDLRAMGYELDKRQVEEIAVFRVTAELLRDYARLGYANLTLREIVDMRVGRVDAEYINAMRSRGYGSLSPRELSEMAIHGITASLIDDYRSLGYANIPRRQLVEMRIFGVTPDYIRKLESLGYHNVPADKLVKVKQAGLIK